jgi:hypothetical protein
VRSLVALLVVVATGVARAQGPADFDGDAVSNAQDDCD